MPTFRLKGLGTTGSFPDLQPADAPPGGWQTSEDVRFQRLRAITTPLPALLQGSPPAPLVGISTGAIAGGSSALFVATATGLYQVDLAADTFVDVTGTATWQGQAETVTDTHLGGQLFFNDTRNEPAYWDAGTTGSFQPLPNWPAGWSCRSLRAFKEYLFALAPKDNNGTEYPFMLKWSDAAAPGTVPATWDPADATADAGEMDLGAGYTPLIDGYPLRDEFIMYRQTDAWAIQWTGDEYVFSARQLFKTIGILATNCVIEWRGAHYVATVDDIIVHDGQSAKSLLDRRARRQLFNEIDPSTFQLSFMTLNSLTNEVIFCYPTQGTSYATRACVIELETGAVTFLDLTAFQPTAFTTGSVPIPPSDQWDTSGTAWDATLGGWNTGLGLSESQLSTYLSSPNGVYVMDGDVSAPTPTLERRGLDLGDATVRKTITRLRFHTAYGVNYQPFQIQFAATGAADETPSYRTPITVDLRNSQTADVLLDGRFFAFKITGGNDWSLSQIDIDFEVSGEA